MEEDLLPRMFGVELTLHADEVLEGQHGLREWYGLVGSNIVGPPARLVAQIDVSFLHIFQCCIGISHMLQTQFLQTREYARLRLFLKTLI